MELHEMNHEDHVDLEMYHLRYAMDDFLAWARRRGYPEVETLLNQYQAERMREVNEHFCWICKDSGLIWIDVQSH